MQISSEESFKQFYTYKYQADDVTQQESTKKGDADIGRDEDQCQTAQPRGDMGERTKGWKKV